MKCVFLNIKKVNYDNKINLINNDQFIYYDSTNEDEILERVKDCNVIVVKEMVMNKKIIESLPESVSLICEAGTGYNNIDLEACNKKGIKVCNVPGYATDNVSLFTIMFILNMSTSFHKQEKMIFNKDFGNFEGYLKVNYSEITGKTLGIIGLGNIGKKVAQMALSLGMKVIYYSRNKKDTTDDIKYVSLEELLKTSDYISLHCALTEDNTHMLNKDNMNLIKPSCYIINTSRGALIDESYMTYMLKNNLLAGAALDVLEHEPCSKDNELLNLDNVIITSHMAWNSIEARQRLMDTVIQNINDFNDGICNNIVN